MGRFIFLKGRKRGEITRDGGQTTVKYETINSIQRRNFAYSHRPRYSAVASVLECDLQQSFSFSYLARLYQKILRRSMFGMVPAEKE